MKKCVYTILFLSYALSAVADIDFRGMADAWRVGRGRAAESQAAARQISNASDGLAVSLDAAVSDLKPWSWGSVNATRTVPLGTVADGSTLRLRFRCCAPPLVGRDLSIGVSDANGMPVPWSRLSPSDDGAYRVAAYRLDFAKAKDGRTPVQPLRLDYINFGFENERGTITFASLEVVPPRTEQAHEPTLALDVETGNPLHLVRTNLAERAVLVWSNRTATARSWRAALTFEGPDGTTTKREMSFGLPAAGVRRDLLPADFPQQGVWHVTACLTNDDGTAESCSTRFARIALHTPQPKIPFGKYRFGLCYHMSSYRGRDRELTLEALTALGAQIARIGGLWYHDYEHVRGRTSWAAADALVDALEARGIAICGGCYANPPWAVKADGTKAHGFGPAAPGFEGDYCERLARRFGTRVDYYEIGNEWDLRRPDVMTIDEAVRVTRECAEGLKRGCPKARVIPAGWAVESSAHPMVAQKGFQERVMKACQDVLDAHPIHVHGPWAMHATRMREFFAMRGREGIRLPWYANETAVTSVWGRERVAAETLWKKVVWSWAHGSTDYIWYNLRATGTNPNDSEQGYGIMTRDYYPRDGFAAFSALATLLAGADFNVSRERPAGRAYYRFAQRRGGTAEEIVVAWDAEGGSGFPLRVRVTDATGQRAMAEAFDLFGNRRALPLNEGEVTWTVGAQPSALIVRGAAKAEVADDDLAHGETVARRVMRLGECLRMADYATVTELYQANPEMLHRLWHGPHDLSAEATLAADGTGTSATMTLVVTDDRDAAGDRAALVVGGASSALTRLGREGACTTYRGAFRLPEDGAELVLEITIEDDDGEGVDVRMSEPFTFTPPHKDSKQ